MKQKYLDFNGIKMQLEMKLLRIVSCKTFNLKVTKRAWKLSSYKNAWLRFSQNDKRFVLGALGPILCRPKKEQHYLHTKKEQHYLHEN